ncbi:hypothetical protein LXL04_027556 [Taraxacum kok-saghyz]
MAPTSAAEPSSATKESPNWLEMPDDLMVNIFQRLPTVEVLKSTRKLWDPDGSLEALIKEAVDLSRGELIDFSIEGFCTDELLDHIMLHANKLKRLCLVNCIDITDNLLSLGVERLKSFKMSKPFSGTYDNHALAIAHSMPELRHLEMSDSDMTNDGLEASVNGCLHLESLDVRGCDNLDLQGEDEGEAAGSGLGELSKRNGEGDGEATPPRLIDKSKNGLL